MNLLDALRAADARPGLFDELEALAAQLDAVAEALAGNPDEREPRGWALYQALERIAAQCRALGFGVYYRHPGRLVIR